MKKCTKTTSGEHLFSYGRTWKIFGFVVLEQFYEFPKCRFCGLNKFISKEVKK